jgi:glycosyltransferase involved in cell wall biosynthesis
MNMCNAFLTNGNNIILIAPKRKHEKKINGINIHEFYNVKDSLKIKFLYYPNIVGGAFIYAFFIFMYLLRNKFDLIYGRFLLGCAVSAKFDTKVMYEAHNESWQESLYSKYLLKYLSKNNNFIKLIVISNSLKEAFLKLQIFNNFKIEVLPDGANKYENLKIPNIRLKGSPGELNICYVGHLYPGKGMEIISKIVTGLKQHRFHIIGGFDEDINYWKKIIKSDNIFFYGHLNHVHVQHYISLMDICLLPIQENIQSFGYNVKQTMNIAKYTSPLKLFEYMSAKKLIIASDLPVIREILNERNSILVKCDDYSAWVKSIKKAENRGLRNKLSNMAVLEFLKNYTWVKRAQKILNMQNNNKK